MLRPLVPLALVALVLAAPLASAHIEGFSQARTLTVGPYLVYLQPQPDTIFANTTLSMTAQVARSDTGSTVRTGVTTNLEAIGPDGYNKTAQMREDRQGSLIASFLLPQRGNYTFRVSVTDANGTHTEETYLEAYPDYPFRIRSVDAEQDVFVGEPATLRFEVVNRTSLRPMDPFADLRIRLEHWPDDHSRLLFEEELALTRDAAEEGVWETTYTFPSVGMFHIMFGSDAGGFTYADVPILHLYATESFDTGGDVGPGANELPAPAVGIVLLALAGIALARRR